VAHVLNLLVQLVTLLNGVMFNFVAPAAYGLSAYGEFIALNAAVFLIYKSMGIVSEPLIRFAKPETIIYPVLLLNAAVWVVFVAIGLLLPIGSPLLLAGMLLTASLFLALQTLRLRRAYIAFQLTISGLFGGLVIGSLLVDAPLPLVRVMELSTGLPALAWLGFVLRESDPRPARDALIATLRGLMHQVPQLLSITAVMNLFTSALPLFLARALVPYDLGLFKVITSVIQSATSLFPVSTTTVLANFVQHARGRAMYRLLTGVATLYFAAAGIGLLVLALLLPALTPYVALAACAPIFFRAVLAERHLIASHHVAPLAGINLAIVLLTLLTLPFVHTVEAALMLYATGFTAYAVLMALMQRGRLQQLPSLLVMLACPLAVYLTSQHLAFGVAYLLWMLLVEVLRQRPTRADIVMLWRQM
jgi:hypothetical protein